MIREVYANPILRLLNMVVFRSGYVNTGKKSSIGFINQLYRIDNYKHKQRDITTVFAFLHLRVINQ